MTLADHQRLQRARQAPGGVGRPNARPLADRLRLLVVTDRGRRPPAFLDAVVGDVLRGGAPAVQLREKDLPPRDLLPLARRLRLAAHRAGALFFVNDRLDLALVAEADGVHLGPDDLPVAAARRLAPPRFLVGASARTPEAARAAEADGADYVGCGPVFPTRTKPSPPIGLDRLAAVVAAVRIPVLAIGGLDAARAPEVRNAGTAGCAVAGALMEAADPCAATAALLAALPPPSPAR